MNRLEIFLLGALKVQFDGEEITETLRTKKERAILSYLAEETPRSHQRQTIAEFFWPDRPENYARMNLRQAVLGIKKAFGGEENANQFLKITENTVRFQHKKAWVDTAEFDEHIIEAKRHAHDHLHTCETCIDHLTKAVACYRGEFLEDMLLGDVTDFQEWIVLRRERHFRSMLDALQLLTRAYYKQNNYDQAYFYAWRYVDMAPLEEPAHRLLMRLLALSGRRNAALQQYEYCKSIIEREFGIEPASETRLLFEQIKSGIPIEKIDTGRLAGSDVPTQPVSQSPSLPTTSQLYDPVTHIPTRPLFMDRLRHTIVRMGRAKLLCAVCVVSVSFPFHTGMDLETKKVIQQHLVRRLVGTVRDSDTVAILGENEYSVILEEIKDMAVIPMIAEKIMRTVGAPILINGMRIRVRLVIGYSIYPKDSMDAVSLLSQADIAMRTMQMQQPVEEN